MDGKDKPQTVSDVFQKVDMALDSYDDLFSDFDPSPYQRRLLSEDFLSELRRRYASTGESEIAVNFTLPRSVRNEKTEQLIKKRVKEHFKARLKIIKQKTREKADNGIIRIACGILLSIALFIFPELDVVPLLTLFSVLIWYSLWSGFENVLEASSSLWKKKAFAEKFMRAEYLFFSQEDVLQSMQKIKASEPMALAETQKADAQPKAESSKADAQKADAQKQGAQKPEMQKADAAKQDKKP